MEVLFHRIEDGDTLSEDEFLDRFERVGFVWFKGRMTKSCSDTRLWPNSENILQYLADHSSSCEKSWSIENLGGCDKESSLTPSSIRHNVKERFYVSTIVHHQDKDALKALATKLPTFSAFQDLHCSTGAWVFVGHHPPTDIARSKKRKRKQNMIGRVEHVDEVTHSGTYHIQLSGSKTWNIRPHPELYCGEELPVELSALPGAEQSELTKAWRLRIPVEEGDVFVLNTKIWYHFTELPPSAASDWSISVARDFYLPFPCPDDMAEGDIILHEDEIPDEVPRTDDPNCALAEVELEDEETDDDSRIVLIALKDIEKGDFLSIALSTEEGDLSNSNETIDPRAVAEKDYSQGDKILPSDSIPDELPRSEEPNCELVNDNGKVILRALSSIAAGEIFCVLPDDDEEYEEVTVDLGTRELQR